MPRTTACCPCRRTASPQTQRTAARQQANRCTKGSLRSPSVQRGAAAPLLHEVLPTVAHRTTTVLQN